MRRTRLTLGSVLFAALVAVVVTAGAVGALRSEAPVSSLPAVRVRGLAAGTSPWRPDLPPQRPDLPRACSPPLPRRRIRPRSPTVSRSPPARCRVPRRQPMVRPGRRSGPMSSGAAPAGCAAISTPGSRGPSRPSTGSAAGPPAVPPPPHRSRSWRFSTGRPFGRHGASAPESSSPPPRRAPGQRTQHQQINSHRSGDSGARDDRDDEGERGRAHDGSHAPPKNVHETAVRALAHDRAVVRDAHQEQEERWRQQAADD